MVRAAVAAVALVAVGVAACSGDDTSPAPRADAGSDATSGVDSSLPPVDAGRDSAVADAGQDAALPVDAGVQDAAVDAPAVVDANDGGLLVLNGCTAADYVDRSDPDAAGRVVQGPPSASPVQYDPPCMTIQAGQSVVFQQHDFSQHPLEPSAGSDSPNPITATGSGATVTFTFPNPGVYGFNCAFHPSQMLGAIQVVQ